MNYHLECLVAMVARCWKFAPRFALVTAMSLTCPLLTADDSDRLEYQRRVETVGSMPGFVAFWDFVHRDAATGRFAAHQPAGQQHDYRLVPANYVLDYWGQGRAATNDDFPLLDRGPFGQAILIRQETENDFRPCLLVPREQLHDTGLDVKGLNVEGAGQSVSMVAWVIRESGNHAVAGIWHEGTDLQSVKGPILRVERGRRQYAIFAGLAAKSGASAVHLSENGAQSFGDKYARHLAVTPEVIPAVASDAPAQTLDAAWSVIGFVFDNQANRVTAYYNGTATEHWIENPSQHNFFRWPARGWRQAYLHSIAGLQPGEQPDYPEAQFYQPPEDRPLRREQLSETDQERVELHHYEFTRVRITLGRDSEGEFRTVNDRELVALKVNPFWFPHDLYAPADESDGGPFTIGRVIHTGRSVGFTGYIGGVAVFTEALNATQMARLANIGRTGDDPQNIRLLRQTDLSKP